MDIPYDPVVQRPEPDREAIALAMEDLYGGEATIQRYVRQQWEATCGANKVAVDAWRRIYPHETRYNFKTADHETVRLIDHHLSMAAFLLDTLSESLLGPVLDAANQGMMTGHEARLVLQMDKSLKRAAMLSRAEKLKSAPDPKAPAHPGAWDQPMFERPVAGNDEA